MKKVFSIILLIVVMFMCSYTVFADPDPEPDVETMGNPIIPIIDILGLNSSSKK